MAITAFVVAMVIFTSVAETANSKKQLAQEETVVKISWVHHITLGTSEPFVRNTKLAKNTFAGQQVSMTPFSEDVQLFRANLVRFWHIFLSHFFLPNSTLQT